MRFRVSWRWFVLTARTAGAASGRSRSLWARTAGPFAVLALLAYALVAIAVAHAISAPPIPNSHAPAWLDNGTIRFESDFERFTSECPLGDCWARYVVAPDGSALRRATDAEVHQTPASPPSGTRLEFGSPSPGYPAGVALYLVGAHGRRRLVEPASYADAGAALSPDGRTAVFAAWIGRHNAASITLYAVATDGSSEPRRLTPTACTLATAGPLGGRCLDGTDVADTLIGTRYGDLVIAGSGDDMIRAGGGQNVIQSQWGDDDIRTGSYVDTVWAGAGNDLIRTGGARDTIIPGPGHDRAWAGAGPDVIITNDGERDVIDCGPGDDRARVDRVDVTRNCEHVTIAPAQPDPVWEVN